MKEFDVNLILREYDDLKANSITFVKHSTFRSQCMNSQHLCLLKKKFHIEQIICNKMLREHALYQEHL